MLAPRPWRGLRPTVVGLWLVASALSASGATQAAPIAVGLGDAEADLVAVSVLGDARGRVAVAAFGDATGGAVAVAGVGDSEGMECFYYAPFLPLGPFAGPACVGPLVVSVVGDSHGSVAVSGVGDAFGEYGLLCRGAPWNCDLSAGWRWWATARAASR